MLLFITFFYQISLGSLDELMEIFTRDSSLISQREHTHICFWNFLRMFLLMFSICIIYINVHWRKVSPWLLWCDNIFKLFMHYVKIYQIFWHLYMQLVVSLLVVKDVILYRATNLHASFFLRFFHFYWNIKPSFLTLPVITSIELQTHWFIFVTM